MSVRGIAISVVCVAACGPDAGVPDEVERCAVVTDLFVRDAIYVRPANTYGDAALELWFGSTNHEGLARQPDGSYAPAWQFEMDEFDGFCDFDGDGLDDPFHGLLGYPAEEPWWYRRMGPDGVPEATSIDLGISPSEVVLLWGDLDEDGLVDRVRGDGGELWLVTGAGPGTSLIIEPSWRTTVQRVPGDPRALAILDGQDTIALMRVGEAGTVAPIWEPINGPWASAHPVIAGQRIDLFLRSAARDITLMQIDLERRAVDERIVERGVDGLLLDDFDGDGNVDLMISKDTSMHVRFGDDRGELGPPKAVPEANPLDDSGPHQTFDLDGDGATELLLALPRPDGRRQWQSLQYEPCD